MRRNSNKGRTSAKAESGREGVSEDIRGVEKGEADEKISAYPDGLREKAKTVISEGELDLTEKRMRYIIDRVEEGVDA